MFIFKTLISSNRNYCPEIFLFNTGLDRNKITIDKEGRMGTDSKIFTDKLQEKESEKDAAAKRHRKASPTR